MASSSSSKGSLLPFDILESIFYKVPAEFLNRFKLVCKKWLNLLENKRFVHNYLDLVQKHFICLFNMVQIINPETNACFSLPFPYEFHDSCLKNIVMHCDGLLLCITDNSSKLAVWNPYFNQVRWILKPNGSYSSTDTYGFGYDSISRDNYKILRFGFNEFTNMVYSLFKSTNGVKSLFEIYEFAKVYNPAFEIYEFKTNSWRTLDAPLDWVFCHLGRGVSVKGNMYWIAKSEHMSKNHIYCFDISTEKFKSTCPFPCDTDKETYDSVALSAYKEDKLSLLHRRSKPDEPLNFEVWITNNVKDKAVSWIKLFAVSRPDLPKLMPSYSSTFIQYFIDKNNRINVIFSEGGNFDTDGNLCVFLKIHIIGEDGFQTKEIGRHRFAGKCSYVYLPSLVLVPNKEDMRKKTCFKDILYAKINL